MAYNALNNLIDAYIYANGVQAITGQILNGVLKQMVSQLGSGYHLMGVAGPQTVPATDDYAMAYFAATAGEYTDFGGITLAAGEVAVLLTSGNGSWSKQTIYNIPTGTADLENTAEFITNAVTDLVNYYTKTEIDTTLADYPTLEDLATALADYYTKTEIDTILADYTTNTALASALADYYNKNDIDGLLSVVNAALADRYTKDETDTKLADYYKKTETYDKDEVDSIVATLSRQEYIVAWDGSSAPDVTAIPAGVTVTYSGTTYTGTLDASASTVNKIYMVWNGTAYDMYGTSQDGGYSWVPMGTTTVDLSQYATKAEVSQLEAEVDGKIEWTNGYLIQASNLSTSSNASYRYSEPLALKAGDKLKTTTGGSGVSLVSTSDSVGTLISSVKSSDGSGGPYSYTIPSDGYYVICYKYAEAGASFTINDVSVDSYAKPSSAFGKVDELRKDTGDEFVQVEQEINAIVNVSPNDDINKYIREMFLDFGTSGYTLADVQVLKMRHQSADAFMLELRDGSFGTIASFGYKQGLSNYLYEGENNGVSVKLIFNPSAPFIPETWFSSNVSFYNKVLDLQSQPLLAALLADKSNAALINAETVRATAAETKNSEDISDVVNAISETTVKNVTSQVGFVDNNFTHYIKTDGSFGSDAMYLRTYNVEGGYSVNIECRAYINVGVTSLMYAFYSSATVFDETTFISGSDPVVGAVVEQETFENVLIPRGAKVLVFADRGGGTTKLVFTKKDITAANGVSLKQVLGYSASKVVKYVKADGTGDYTTVQDAINDITDATITKQYEIRLCNDEVYTDMTDLWLVSSPASHNTNASPSASVAAIITKDWITIVGYNHRRKVCVYAPDSMAVTSQQYVQCLYLMGCATVENIDFEIKNGRYALHQESGGSTASLDYNARTIMRNCNVVHLGNVHGTGYWDSCYAQANGTCAGLQLEYYNVTWSPSFYMHQNGDANSPNSYLFENCRIAFPFNGVFDGVELGCYIGMNGSGQNSRITFRGCDIKQIRPVIDMFDNNVSTDAAHDIRTMIPIWEGYGNAKTMYPQIDIVPNVLALGTSSANHNIDVTGGTAKSSIFGDGFAVYEGTANKQGLCIGSEYIGKRGDNTCFTLGTRLGDCSLTSKTLVIEYDGVEHTLTFNEDYSSMNNATILGKINTMLQTLGVDASTVTSAVPELEYSFPMADCCEIGNNYSQKSMVNGCAVRRDASNQFGWVVCSAGEKPDGIACERIDPNHYGKIAIIEKNFIPLPYGLYYSTTRPVGTMLKVNNDNGAFTTTSNPDEAVLIAVADNCFVGKK